MKAVLLLLPAFFILSCDNSSQEKKEVITDTQVQTVTQELPVSNAPVVDPVSDTLMKLPFIIKSNKYIDSFSNHRHGISFIRDTVNGIVSIKAGYNGEGRFETYYDLVIDSRTGEIKIMDVVEGDYIPLKQYMENNR